MQKLPLQPPPHPPTPRHTHWSESRTELNTLSFKPSVNQSVAMPHSGHCRVVPYFWSGPFTPRWPGLGHSRVVWLGPFTPRPRVVWLGPFSGGLVGAIYTTVAWSGPFSGDLAGAIYTTASGGLAGAILGWSGWGHSRVVWSGPFTPRPRVVWLRPFTPRPRVVWLGPFSGGLAGAILG